MATPQSVNPKPVYQTKAAFTARAQDLFCQSYLRRGTSLGDRKGNRAKRGVFPLADDPRRSDFETPTFRPFRRPLQVDER